MQTAGAQSNGRGGASPALRSEIGQSFYLLALMAAALGGPVGLALLAVRLLG